jgi:hypothetical protein
MEWKAEHSIRVNKAEQSGRAPRKSCHKYKSHNDNETRAFALQNTLSLRSPRTDPFSLPGSRGMGCQASTSNTIFRLLSADCTLDPLALAPGTLGTEAV